MSVKALDMENIQYDPPKAISMRTIGHSALRTGRVAPAGFDGVTRAPGHSCQRVTARSQASTR